MDTFRIICEHPQAEKGLFPAVMDAGSSPSRGNFPEAGKFRQ